MIKQFLKKVEQRRTTLNDDGFSLLELVVAVGILLVLTVGGLLAYSGITDNARNAAVSSAASEVYTAAASYEADNQADTVASDAGSEWTASADADGGLTARSGVDADGQVGSVVERRNGTDITHTATRGAAEATWVSNN